MSSTAAPTAAHPQGQATVKGDDWRKRAECLHEDPELFFPIGIGRESNKQEGDARAVCEDCPVSRKCLLFALENQIDHGVWGGIGERDRRIHHHRLLLSLRTNH